MKKTLPIKILFLDIGRGLLTDGWPTASRKQAAKQFGLDCAKLGMKSAPVAARLVSVTRVGEEAEPRRNISAAPRLRRMRPAGFGDLAERR